MAHSLAAIFSLLIILLICGGTGRLVLRLAAPKLLTDSSALLYSLAFGMGAVSYLVMALGLLGLLYPVAVLVILALLALVSLREMVEVIHTIGAGLRTWKPSPITLLAAIPLGLLAIFALIGCLAAPSMNDWDTLAYHFAAPALYIKWHGIHHVPFMLHSTLPFLTEMLYTIGLMFPAAGGAGLAKLFHLAAGVLTVLIIYAIGRRHFSSLAGIVGAVVFASIPLMGWEATAGYIDLTAAMFLALAVLALMNHWEEESQWSVVAAISLGFAAATKTTMLMFIPMAAIWLVYNDVCRRRDWRNGILGGIWLAITALLIASPWYIKSWIHTGNPIYPFAYSMFGGLNWSERLGEIYRTSQVKFGMGSDLRSLFLVPWNLTMNPGRYFDWNVLFACIGPVFLIALPMFAAVRFGRTKLRMLLVFLAASFVIWFYMTQQSRYLIPAMAIGAVAVGALVDELRDLRVARALLFIGIGVGVAFGLFVSGYMAMDEAQGIADPDAYLTRTLDIYPACRFINEELPANSKILLISDTRGFHIHRDYQWGDQNHSTLIPYDSFRTPADMAKFLRGKGFTHVLINFGVGSMRAKPPARCVLLFHRAIDDGLLKPVFDPQPDSRRRVAVFEFSQ